MAFVYRAAPGANDKNNNIGPGSYENSLNVHKKSLGYAPFSSTVERFPKEKSNKKQDFKIPGPGAYNISQDLISEKIIVSNVQTDIKIIEVPKESSVFKSKTEKMEHKLETKDITPGPGYYYKGDKGDLLQIKQNVPPKEILPSAFLSTNEDKVKQKHPTISLVEGIKKNNIKYQLVPSIPSRKEAFGYTESESHELMINRNPTIKYSGVGVDSIGPGQYESKESIEKKGYSWWKSNSKRITNMKSQTLENIGPGAYNPSLEIRKLYSGKPTSAFLSNISRSDEKKKGKQLELFEKKMRSKENSGDQSDESHFNISAFEEQLFKNQINDLSSPGPGHYHNEKLISSLNIVTKPVPKQNFGSSDIRFKDNTILTTGPGEYNPKIDLNTKRIKPRIKIPFISGIDRFDKNTENSEIPGPGSYSNTICLENELIRKIQNGYKGNFGSMEKRFDIKNNEINMMNIPGPGHYDAKKISADQEKSKNHSIFKSKTQRNTFATKNDIPGIGTYELDQFNLENSSNQTIGYEPYAVAKKPPFNTSEPRFIHGFSGKKEIPDSENKNKVEVSSLSLNTSLNGKKRYGSHFDGRYVHNKKTSFNVKANRFNYKTQTTPGPGQYDSERKVKDSWKKKSFNILFADI